MTSRFTGVIPPMITPLTADEEIDLPARIDPWHRRKGVEGRERVGLREVDPNDFLRL